MFPAVLESASHISLLPPPPEAPRFKLPVDSPGVKFTTSPPFLTPPCRPPRSQVNIGCGPCGELRYPAYPENKRCLKASQWRFPGIGEFQCYDKRALLSLAKGASEAGHIEWGGAGPHDAGG